jgi:hypothetical protein
MISNLMKSICLFYIFFYLLISITLAHGGINNSQNKIIKVNDVETIEAEDNKIIDGIKIFLLKSCNYGFIFNICSKSPLMNTVPQNISPSFKYNEKSTQYVVVQHIPTNHLPMKYVDCGTFLDDKTIEIVCSSPPIVQNLWGLVLLFTRVPIELLTNTYKNLVYIVIDNSLDNDIIIIIDDKHNVKINKKSQMTLTIKKDVKHILVKKQDNDEIIDNMEIDFNNILRNTYSDDCLRYFIINIGKNKYVIEKTNYKK